MSHQILTKRDVLREMRESFRAKSPSEFGMPLAEKENLLICRYVSAEIAARVVMMEFPKERDASNLTVVLTKRF